MRAYGIATCAFCAHLILCVAGGTGTYGYEEELDANGGYEYDYVYPQAASETDVSNPTPGVQLLDGDCISEEAKRHKKRDVKDTTFLNELLHGYDQRIRPNNGGIPVKVNISVFVNSFYSINEQTMVVVAEIAKHEH